MKGNDLTYSLNLCEVQSNGLWKIDNEIQAEGFYRIKKTINN